MSDNLKYWNTFNQPPRTALKEIAAGRMKGKTDINPQWRYKAMTETFGPVGIGWKFTNDKMWTETGANNETFAFVNISVYVKIDGVWSDAIPGNGGATLIVSEKNGLYNDDDAFKKATTDALSTAMKMLGVAADIYAGGWDGAKYRNSDPSMKSPQSQAVTVDVVNQEVHYDKKPAPAPKVANEIITDSEWEHFDTLRLQVIAENPALKLPEYDRSKMKPADLNNVTKYFHSKLEKAGK